MIRVLILSLKIRKDFNANALQEINTYPRAIKNRKGPIFTKRQLMLVKWARLLVGLTEPQWTNKISEPN